MTKTCTRCGLPYEVIGQAEHNDIHTRRAPMPPTVIDLGEGATPEAVEAFRRLWRRSTNHG